MNLNICPRHVVPPHRNVAQAIHHKFSTNSRPFRNRNITRLHGAANNVYSLFIMRLSCPGCQTEYEVPDAALAGRVRTLRCANCSHQWEYGPLPVTAAIADPVAAAWPGAAPRSVFSDMQNPAVEPPPPPTPRPTPATDKYEPLEPPTPRGAWPPPPEPVPSRYEPLTSTLAEPVTDPTETGDEPATSQPAELPPTPQTEPDAAVFAKTTSGNEERFAALVKTSRNEPEFQTGPSARAGVFTTLILLIGIGAGIWAARFHIMQAWPPSTRLFDAINTIIASFTTHH
jgi:predicted Zn finger-like uncharacterized protein